MGIDCALTSAQKSFVGVHKTEGHESEAEDLEKCTLETCSVQNESELKSNTANNQAEEVAVHAEAGGIHEVRSKTNVHILGCPEHRIYSSSLLLMHCEIQRRIARGPPGLELPASTVSAPIYRAQSIP